MKYYKFGDAEGRFIGNTEKYSVYENVISEHKTGMSAGTYKNLPGEFTFAYGPATGGLLESVSFDLHTPGELIKHVDVDPYCKIRTLRLKGLTPQDALLRIERLNGFHSVSNAVAFEMAVEDALEVYVPEGVRYSRLVMLELERIRSNLEVVKRMCEPAGFGVPLNQLAYLVEKAARIISGLAGHRYFFSASSVGGCNIKTDRIEAAVRELSDEFAEIFDGLLHSKIFLNRLLNNGIVKEEPLLGPAARSAGRNIDARVGDKLLPYSEIGFKPFIFDEPDAFGRFYVRSQEILESAEMILNVIDKSRNSASVDSVAGSGNGAARIESPQGDLFYYVDIKDGRIDDLQISSPSLLNIYAFIKSMAGNIFTDYHFNWESFGIWISELAVVIK